MFGLRGPLFLGLAPRIALKGIRALAATSLQAAEMPQEDAWEEHKPIRNYWSRVNGLTRPSAIPTSDCVALRTHSPPFSEDPFSADHGGMCLGSESLLRHV
jgi:hypothetical protein